MLLSSVGQTNTFVKQYLTFRVGPEQVLLDVLLHLLARTTRAPGTVIKVRVSFAQCLDVR